MGDNTNKRLAKFPWRKDDEKITYKAYELCVKYGIKNVCVHKGLFPMRPPSVSRIFSHMLKSATSAKRRKTGRN